jgi:hypothetical protein
MLYWAWEQQHLPNTTLYSPETFAPHKGSLTVYTSPDMSEAFLEAKTLEVGESVTVPPKQTTAQM